MSFQACRERNRPGESRTQRFSMRSLSKANPLPLGLLSVSLFLTMFSGLAHGAGPCTCSDIDKIQTHLDRVTKSEEVWKEIFAWARGLHPGVDLPQTNDDLDQKHTQLSNSSKSQWRELIKQGPVKDKKSLRKVAGLSDAGEPVVNDDFKKNNCDDIIEGEHVHEQAHRDFYLSFRKIIDAGMSSRLLRLRAESEVESYRTHKAFLDNKLTEQKLKCMTKADRSTKQLLEQALAQRERFSEADSRLRMFGNSQQNME
jgi:hypothetical protein